jgi:hypothetical protein
MPASRPRQTPATATDTDAGETRDPINALIVVPTLDVGAADAGAAALARILARAGHRVIMVSRPGRLVADVTAAGAEFIPLDMGGNNPVAILRNAFALMRIARERKCDLIHAHGRAAAWSALVAARLTGIPFVTTWYKGFRDQNVFKHLYNGVMARGDRVIAVSEQLAQLVNDRYGTPWERIKVLPSSIDFESFDPARVTRASELSRVLEELAALESNSTRDVWAVQELRHRAGDLLARDPELRGQFEGDLANHPEIG